jgi:hypothetical protein
MFKAKSTTTAKAKTLMANRLKYLLATLTDKGIKPSKVTQTIVGSGSANNIVVTAKYIN